MEKYISGSGIQMHYPAPNPWHFRRIGFASLRETRDSRNTLPVLTQYRRLLLLDLIASVLARFGQVF
jgi:hypothetical protein